MHYYFRDLDQSLPVKIDKIHFTREEIETSLFEVTTTSLASVLHHGSTFLLSFNENIAFEYRHICLLGDFNFPKTDWSTFSSSSARETSFLNI